MHMYGLAIKTPPDANNKPESAEIGKQVNSKPGWDWAAAAGKGVARIVAADMLRLREHPRMSDC